jgi:hypothetical protein
MPEGEEVRRIIFAVNPKKYSDATSSSKLFSQIIRHKNRAFKPQFLLFVDTLIERV